MKPSKLERAYAIEKRNRQRAAQDLHAFIEFACLDDMGNPLELSSHHKWWMRHIRYCFERQLRCMILSPFGHGKSSSLAVPLAAWMLGNNPNIRIKVITNDDANATRRVMGVSKLVESPEFKRVFPKWKRGEKWTDHEFYLERSGHALDPTIQAKGVFGTGIGGRADLIIFDDVVDQKNSQDAGQRKKVTQLLEQTWLSRLSPRGQVLYIATPWHLDDATHHFMRAPGWCTLVQRVPDDWSGISNDILNTFGDYPLDPL